MTTHIDHIFIFKSNIKTDRDEYFIKGFLNMQPCIQQWSVDIDDQDCILRIISATLNEKSIIDLVNKCGYNCEPLID